MSGVTKRANMLGVTRRAPFTRLLREAGAFMFLLPHLALFILFVVVPLGYGLFISFHRWTFLDPPRYVGWGNFVRIWGDARFWDAVVNTVVFATISVPITVALALLFALLLNQQIYGRLWLMVAFVSPAFFGSIGILLSWNWILASFPSGLVNFSLLQAGLLTEPVSWFATPTGAWLWIIVITVWWIVGFGALLFLGALQKIPPEQYESAMLDGAGILARFQHITLPWIRNVLIFETVRQVILAFGLFDQVFILTGGGPAGTTRTMVFYLYQLGFERQQLGFAAAVAWYIFIVIIVFGLIQLLLITRSIRTAEE